MAFNPSSMSPKITKKQTLVDSIFRPNELGVSEWITRDTLSTTQLPLINNGNGRYGIFYGDARYMWETKRNTRRTVIALRTNGFNQDALQTHNRPIRKDIEKYHKQMGCVVCGSKSQLVTDHKNDVYNDPRVLDTNTQTKDDFQCLCTHCNLQKR